MAVYRVLITDREGFDGWRADIPGGAGFAGAVKARIAERGETVLCWQGRDLTSFMWMCPGCGSTYAGLLGDTPVSGWDSPRWVNSGTREVPTLTPSLGCGNWRRGECDGHWWLRNGELVRAA